ncbi:sigma-54-dependent Fis family transcriptional regulator [Kyrpidia sp.]|uniref:sigma-54-dependent Fis family transcriptional regulator n=1 Tax=Kyrpidia sp. TaxID=2073077 RepID=UPI002590C320|nr:sigma-54-dependent Fis family transcriptional regulator [Kyrpidia sp.]MCL6575118.1 sigma 54-interacting transcriptional regulator [Kyrpidia sp.]
MKVGDCYTPGAAILAPGDTLADVMRAFLRHRLDIACVLNDRGHLDGIVSKYALYRALLAGAGLDSPVGSLVRRDVVVLRMEDSLESAKDTLLHSGVGHGVVVDGKGQVCGVMGKSDIIRGFLLDTEMRAQQVTVLLDHLQEAVVFIDREQRVQAMNQAAEALFHVDKDVVLGTPVAKWLPELAGVVADAVERSIALPAGRLEIGDTVTLTSVSPIGGSRNAAGAMAVIRDITTLEAIAEELETTKNLQHTLQHAVALSYDGIAVVDPEGRITVANDALAEILDADRESLVGRPWGEAVPDVSLRRVLEGREVEGQVYTLRGRPCLITQEPIERSGKCVGAIIKVIWRRLDEWRDLFRRLEQLEREVNYYRGEWQRSHRSASAFDAIVGRDTAMEALKREARLAASTTSTVLITGESGTGKELFARAIHQESGRPGAFVAVNCAAVPAELLESEFFGYVEGAFTGARRGGKPGKFELADRGTLFLDEIGDMPFALQSKLLRFLQEQVFERVGDVRPRQVDVRIIAATHQDLEEMVRNGMFREDLYYRIHVVHLKIPPLRDRLGDLPLLCQALIQKLNGKLNRQVKGVSPEAFERLRAYSWPGNVRQLENVLERAMNLGVSDMIDVADLPKEMREVNSRISRTPEPAGAEGPPRPRGRSREAWEKEWVLGALEEAGGNRTRAAQILGISRSTLYHKLRKYRIEEEVRFRLGAT